MKFLPFVRRTLVLGGILWSATPLVAAPTVKPAPKAELSVVRVNSTTQDYDFFRPWSKKNPRALHGLGAVLPGNRVLVTAQLVANHTYVELERAGSGQRTDAKVVCVDYEANLALLEPNTDKFLAELHPMELTQDAVVGDRVSVLQLESNDALVSTPGPITTIEVGRYQLEGISMLIYRLSLPLQYREGSFTAPVIKDGKLAGMLMRYDPRAQTVDVLPAPVIEHFLKDFDTNGYQGFPKIGLEHAPLRDPQLRHYAKLPANSGGVYVTEIVAESPAAKAGLKAGDVLLEVAGQAIDQDGNYLDPLYGKIAFVNLITTKAYVGEKLPVKVFRDGQTMNFEVDLAHKSPQDYVSPPYVIDQAPRYCVVDGLIFTELSRQYLKEWGNDWAKQAPQRLVYLDRYQSTLLPGDHKRIVVLSQVLPVASNVGYEDLKSLVVTRINDLPIGGLDDVAKALGKPANGFDKINFEDAPKEIFVDANHLTEDNRSVQESYSLPALERLN